MMFRCIVFAAVVCLATKVQQGDGYRILCLFPTQSLSHQIVLRALSLELNKRGHELVVVTPEPINDPTLANYTEIDVSVEYSSYGELNYAETRGKLRWLDRLQQIHGRFHDFTDQILNHPDLKKLYLPNSNETFDLLIVELLRWQGMYPLAIRFDVPMIGITSFVPNLHSRYSMGNPVFSSDLSNWELETEVYPEMSFWQRFKNFITIWKYVYWWKNTYIPRQEAIAKKYFGNDIPDLNELEKNISLIFVNEQTPISYARANIPKVIGIGGFHVSKEKKNLPKDLQKILDGAWEGFVYISLGSNAKSNMLPKKLMNQFITAFSRLPYKVLWKFEDDVLPDKPDNVHIMKWVPQQAVLAHPNLKAFIYQGGLQSTEEAIHHAVPLVGIPLLFDQDMQVNKMVSLGVAKKLEILSLDGNELFETISTVASDISYKQRMLNLRSLIIDKPHDPMKNAVWWTEHVIRHRGARHLYSVTADEPWYSRYDMDIVAFISAGIVMVFGLTLVILYQLVKSIRCAFGAGSLNEKKIN